MRTVLKKWAALAAAVIVAASALAQLPEERRLDLRLDNADLATAITMLGQKTGLQFVIEPSDIDFKTVSLNLKDKTLDEVLKALCQAAGATYRRDEGGWYVIGHTKPVVPTPPTNGDPEARPIPKGPRTVQKFLLMRSDPRDMMLKLANREIGDARDTLLGLNRFQKSNNPHISQFFSNGPMVNGYTQSGNYRPVSSAQLEATPVESGADILLPGEAAGQGSLGGPPGGGQGRGGFGGGQGGGGFGGGQGGFGQGGGGFGGQGGFNLQGGQGFVPQGIDQVTYDPTDNSLIVQGTDEAIAELQRLITMFDVAPKQVTIKVEFITTSNSVASSLGFDWTYERGPVFTGTRPGTFARAGDPIFLNWSTGNVVTRMRMLLQHGNGRVVQAPIVRTLNNQPASVQQNVLTTIFVSQVVATGNGQTIIAPQPFQITITTGLSVAPRINNDGTVTVFLFVPVQDFGQLRRGPDGTEFPDVLSQVISVVARVKDGETIALGGLVRKQDTGSLSKFPVLGDLPLIGSFFTSRTRDRNNTELLIFVTPKIIDDEGNNGLGP